MATSLTAVCIQIFFLLTPQISSSSALFYSAAQSPLSRFLWFLTSFMQFPPPPLLYCWAAPGGSSFAASSLSEVLPFQLSLSALFPSLGAIFFPLVSLLLLVKSFLSSLVSSQLPAWKSRLSSHSCKAFWRNKLKQWSVLCYSTHLSPSKYSCFASPCTLILSREHFSLLPLTDSTDAYLSRPLLSYLPLPRAHSHGFIGINCLDIYENVLVTISELCSLLNSRR